MRILISLSSDKPIYDQIKTQVISAITTGELKPGDQLPSIRYLSTTLQVGIITTKRAYDDLVKDGLLISKMGKGYYVSEMELSSVRLLFADELINKFRELKPLIKNSGLSLSEIKVLLEKILEDQK